jgi:hypothetical protein
MITIERTTQKIYPGKWAALEEIDGRYNEIEQNNGFPAKRRYKFVIGEDMNTLIIERQWDCLAVLESTYEKVMVLPEYQALGQELESIVEYSKTEILMPLP